MYTYIYIYIYLQDEGALDKGKSSRYWMKIPSVQYSLLEGDCMMHVEAFQWLICIFTGRLRANCHQLYESSRFLTRDS